VLVEHLGPYLFADAFDDPNMQTCLLDMFAILRELASRRVAANSLDQLELRIAVWLSTAELVLPATEMAIVLHLMVHLPAEIRRWGPVKEYWMYSVERCLQSSTICDCLHVQVPQLLDAANQKSLAA